VDFQGTERFLVCRRLGEGGMGVVFEVVDREQGVKVALKCLNASDNASLLQLKDEFRSLRDVHHPNLVSLGELIEVAGQWFFTMELVEGTDLLGYVRPDDPASWPGATGVATGGATLVTHADAAGEPIATTMLGSVRRPAGFDNARVRSSLAQLAQGLQALHEAGKIHRDIKPSNVLVTRAGRLVISDFGLVTKRVMFDSHSEVPSSAIGTPAYMAPELTGSRVLEPASDWFSVGVVLYRVLVGRVPFEGTFAALQYQKLSNLAIPPAALVENLDEDLAALCMDLLEPNPADRPNGRDVLDRLGIRVPELRRAAMLRRASAGNHLFVGRSVELETLRTTMRTANQGPGELVILQGESGVGKSTLSRRFAEDVLAEDPAALLLNGRCHERESVPYKAFDGIMDELTRQLRELPAAELEAYLPANAAALGQLFPVFAQLPIQGAKSTALASDANERRTQLFLTLRTMFAMIAAHRPVVLILDDLQWADADSLLLLRELMRGPAPPIMVLAPVRASADEPWWPAAGRHLLGARVHHLLLHPLPVDVACELVRSLAATLGAGSELDAAAIAAGAAGHPMFIQELLLHMKARGDWSVRALALDDALAARVSQLSPDARELLVLVALVGTPIHNDALRDAADMAADRFAAASAELQQQQLTRATGLRRSDATEPFHARIGETVIARLEPERRRSSHARLARALGASRSADAELVATHWQEAGEPAAAYQYALRAAREADAALSFMRSARLYRYCLTLLGPGDTVRTGELLEKLAEATCDSGHSAEGAALFLRAADHFEGLRSSSLRRSACEKLLHSGHFTEGLRELAALLEGVGLSLPSARWKVLSSTLTQRARLRLRGVKPREEGAQTVTPERMHELDVLWTATTGLGLSDTMLSAGFSARQLRYALEFGDPLRLVRALTAEYALQAGLAGRETRITRELMATARAYARGNPELENQCTAWLASVEFVHGSDFHESLEHALCSERYYLSNGAYRDELTAARHFANASMWYVGDWRELCERVTSQLAQALEQEDLLASTNLVSGSLNSVWLCMDQPALAEQHLDDQLARWPRDRFLVVHFYELYARTQLDLYRDDPGRALERLTDTWRALKRSFLLRIPIIRYMMHDVRSRAALGLARTATGAARRSLVALARRDRKVIARTGVCFAQAATQAIDAAIASLDGDADESVRLWSAAAVGFEVSGLRFYAAAARYRAARLRGQDTAEAEAPFRLAAVVAPGTIVRLLSAEG
jgi:serine/threonine protein kinase